MAEKEAHSLFENLTAKQHEALNLASQGLTSKEIARLLKISHHSVDKRIDAVRLQLDGVPRNTLVRLFREWESGCHSITGDQSPLTKTIESTQRMDPLLTGETLEFSDVAIFDARADWAHGARWEWPGIEPSDLSKGWRLLLIIIGAFFIAAAFVLVAAGANVLIDLLK